MAKYYSFLLIASMWFFTVLCVGKKTVSVPDVDAKTLTDLFNENLNKLVQEFADISKSSNKIVKKFRDSMSNNIKMMEGDKEEIKNRVIRGMQWAKKIRNISQLLNKMNTPLIKEFQSELKEIQKNASGELRILKKMGNTDDMDNMQKVINEKNKEYQKRLETLAKLIITEVPTDATAEAKAKIDFDTKTEGFKFISIVVSYIMTSKKDEEIVSKKMEATYKTYFNIRDGLVRVKQIEYHILRSLIDHNETDASSLTPSSVAQCAFAIILGMLF